MDPYFKSQHLTEFARVSDASPELGKKFFDYYGAVFADGALSAREKSLIALAVAHTFSTRYFERLAHTNTAHAGLWHLLGEVEATCDRVAFVKSGVVVHEMELARAQGTLDVELRVGGVDDALLEELAAFGTGVTRDDTLVRMHAHSESVLPELARWLVGRGVALYELRCRRKTLEEPGGTLVAFESPNRLPSTLALMNYLNAAAQDPGRAFRLAGALAAHMVDTAVMSETYRHETYYMGQVDERNARAAPSKSSPSVHEVALPWRATAIVRSTAVPSADSTPTVRIWTIMSVRKAPVPRSDAPIVTIANCSDSAGMRTVATRDGDGWTVRTKDGSLSAHWEHTVAITPDGPMVFTASTGPVPVEEAATVT